MAPDARRVLDAEARALAIYRRSAGRRFYAPSVYAYADPDASPEALEALGPFESGDVAFPGGLPVTVDPGQDPRCGLLNWNNEWLDPFWDVTPAEPLPPELRGTGSWWVMGPSLNGETGEVDWGSLREAPEPEQWPGRYLGYY